MQVNFYQNNYQNNLNFRGFKNPISKSLVVLDLERALGHSSPEATLKLTSAIKDLNAKVAYLTKNKFKTLTEFKTFCSDRGITLPNPDYLIGNSCDNLYKPLGSVFIGDCDYKEKIRTKTRYNSGWVNNILVAQIELGKYSYSDIELLKLKSSGVYNDLLMVDRTFAKSKISPLKTEDEFTNEVFVSPDVDPIEFGKEIVDKLKERGIKAVYKITRYPDKMINEKGREAVLKAHKLRRNPDGSVTAVIFSPVGKADCIRHVRDSLGVSSEEMLIATTDRKDIGLTKFSAEDAKFVCLSNAQPALKKYCQENPHNNIYITKKPNCDGMLEGINHFKSMI